MRAGDGDIGGDERKRVRRADMGDREHKANCDTLALHDNLLQRMDVFQFFHITFRGLLTGNMISWKIKKLVNA